MLQVEYAKSGRSSCKQCNCKISQGVVRVGSPYEYKGTTMFSWTHLECATLNDASKISGISALREPDQCSIHSKCTPHKSGVYVLELNRKGRYYVGKSNNLPNRIAQHTQGTQFCAKWVQINGGVKKVLDPITTRTEDLNAWEMNETLARMVDHGINNVRGFEWTTTKDLGHEELVSIKTLCCGMKDLCRKCGLPGHMSTACYTKRKAPWMLEYERSLDSTESDEDNDICFRCGRSGHWASKCYAKRDVCGKIISL
jgi:hypothetical protein